jgi:hypothetical protein
MRMMDTVRTMFAVLENDKKPSDIELQDVALSRSDFNALKKAPEGSRERMVFMAERFGLSESQLNSEHWRAVDMARTCAQCGVAGSCEAFRKGRSSHFEPAQCPNAPQFSELTV